MKQTDRKQSQRGGFAIGLIVGLLIGLALALGVAVYVTKVPVPFVDKVGGRTPEQDAAEAEKNRNWDPNAPLHGKNPARPRPVAPAASGAVVDAPASAPAAAPASAPVSQRDPAAILAGEGAAAPAPQGSSFYVQAGAFAGLEEAEQQRAKLAMLGLEGRISERDQAGKVVYRVRVGPLDRAQADEARAKLGAAGVESALIAASR
ncbi:MAG: SPOR domain-containing protein [Pseudomonadota bacterium]